MRTSRIRIGTAPISWGACEIPKWGDQLPYAQVLDEMAACGYEGTELGPWSYLPTDPTALKRELDARKLSLAGAFCPVTLHDRDRRAASLRSARETIDLLVAAGAPVLVLADAGDERRTAIAGRVPPDGSSGFSHAEWRRFSDGVNEIARRASERGLITAFHPHAASYVERPEEISRLMRDTDPTLVGLCLDTGHVAYGGGDPAEVARTHARRIRHVHLKDLRREVRVEALERNLDFREAVGMDVFAPLGEGSLDLRATLNALSATGYAGWLIVEQDVRLGVSTRASPLRDAQRSRAFLDEVLAA
ncbi:MAG TPA: TIM barrel protein [Candidatus Limnocylindria bacterium]|nr:TIM barrel protein [Candidatus Limnocylindria bacterium]